MKSWDPSAVMALVSILGAVILGATLSILAFFRGRVNASSLKFVIAVPSLLLIVGLKVYAQIGSDALTFVFGAVVGYILGGQPLQPNSKSDEEKADSS